jgi:uncharacterized protein (DUF2062 family)
MKEKLTRVYDKKLISFNLRQRLKKEISRIKEIHGEPHYVALGMAIGVFVAVTPTIPFHTVIAVGLSLILRGSKMAAAIGVWFSNPITIPLFYLGSYKAGKFFFGDLTACNGSCESMSELVQLGLQVSLASITGGIIIGLMPGVATYFITRKIVTKMRTRKNAVQYNSDTPEPQLQDPAK